MRSTEWFYAIDEQQQGPVPFQHLKKLASQGLLGENDLIWHSGLDEWIQVSEQPGLMTRKKGRSKTPSGTSEHTEASADSQTLLWSGLLNQFRNSYTAPKLKGYLRLLASTGGGAILATTLLIALIYLILAIKTNTFYPILWGLAQVLLVSSLRFAALRSLHSGEQLIFNTPQQINSLALLNSVAVLMLTAGTLGPVLLLVTSMEAVHLYEQVPLVMGAIGLAFVYVAGAVAVLRPDGFNISDVPGSHAGREGVSVVLFLLKLQVRQSSFIFAACGVLACISFGWAAYLLAVSRGSTFFDRSTLLDPLTLSLIGSGTLSILAANIVPILSYLMFAVGSIFPTACEVVFQIPTMTVVNQSPGAVSESFDA
ncbi:DUF4339 domain-containing protein [Planctomicrobium sp. SH661]|uniref:DUF4339 domain-containing protein n=1 Tax=Planctomicrobium sp. SH661 TaxID=3448124 RepID=UPI003F5C8D94